MRLPQLDPTSTTPLYRQLQRHLANAIDSGELRSGEPLPSSRALAVELGLSRNTVNVTYQELIAEGFVETLPRRGHIIARDLQRHLRSRSDEDPREPIDWHEFLQKGDDTFGAISKPAGWSRVPYPFVVGQPDLDMFPTLAWNRALRNALGDDHAPASLNDLVDRDDELLLEALCRHVLPARGISAEPSEVLITIGSQHAIFLVGQALLRSGSVVGVEEPGYPDAKHIFRRAGADLVPLPVDDQGVVVPDSLDGFRAVFVTPSHQYPTNVTLAIGRRQLLLAEAQARDLFVIEDDYDSEFQYRTHPTPSLKALDEVGRVIHLGSFTKFLAPGLRMGYLVAEAPLIEHLRDLRRYMIRHPPGILQRALALMIESGDYSRSVRRVRKRLKAKWERMTEAVSTHLPWTVDLPPGGVSVWLGGPETLDARSVTGTALARGVVVEPGDVCFLADPPPVNYMKLGFSAVHLDAIDPGIKILADVISSDTVSHV